MENTSCDLTLEQQFEMKRMRGFQGGKIRERGANM